MKGLNSVKPKASGQSNQCSACINVICSEEMPLNKFNKNVENLNVQLLDTVSKRASRSANVDCAQSFQRFAAVSTGDN